ncbi:MAG TPA: glycosyl hydrolase 108 family protein [Syntrophorhabdaceae bacterium]|nr:glycosyl hydrolase 108 family protein [Syntrophorhabdaceae bacterium]
MANFLDILDMVVMNKIVQTKRNDISRISKGNNNKFNNLLSQNISKLENKKSQPGPLKKITLQNNTNPLTVITINHTEKGDFETALEIVLRHEGDKLVNKDGSSNESSKYGILQSTARAMGFNGNIKDLTMEQARAIYERLWDQSGAANLPAPLSIVYFDTYVNSPAMAKKLLTKSNNDINVFLNMREQRYIKLAEKRPDVFGIYLKGWKNRITNLKAMVAGLQEKGISKGA